MYSLPQEIEVWYIIPAIRKELAKILVKKHNQTYQKVGDMLGISKAAISQYLSNKRANKIKFPSQLQKEIEKSANIILKDGKKSVREIQKILKTVRLKKFTCDLCEKYNSDILKFCKDQPCN